MSPVSSSQPLPVLMPSVPNQRWSCQSCGKCCRSLVGHLSEEERIRLDRQDWSQELGVEPYVRTGRQAVLNKRDDGACVFLDENNRCMIHAKYGEAAKPLACRIFPFSVRAVDTGWQASFRFDCPSATSSQGKPIDQYRPWLGDLVRKLEHRCPAHHDTADLQGGVRATRREIDKVVTQYTQWFKHSGLSVSQRLIGGARVTATLQAATLKDVRGSRFGELISLLFKALPDECNTPPIRSTTRQRGLLRQLAFAHAEHVSLSEMRAGRLGQLKKRLQQLGYARRFLSGRGTVPPLPGYEGRTTFAIVDATQAVVDGANEVDDLLLRYVIARLQSRSVFGDGYYGWPVFAGLNALWLSIAVVGWLARLGSAAQGRTQLTFHDVARALGIVDRAATRVPSLGTTGERARARYLSMDDGVAGLLNDYLVVESAE